MASNHSDLWQLTTAREEPLVTKQQVKHYFWRTTASAGGHWGPAPNPLAVSPIRPLSHLSLPAKLADRDLAAEARIGTRECATALATTQVPGLPLFGKEPGEASVRL
jgi:hypothetical protein